MTLTHTPSRRGLLTGTRSAIVGVIAAAAAVVLIASPAQAQTAAVTPPPTAGLQYVALGDSYAAGFGITPGTGAPVPGCQQAAENYPHQVAAQLGLDLTDVTCTGAVTANIIGTSQVTPDYFGGGTALPQVGALSADTDVVSVSIGGNDAGFSQIAEECLALTATGPVAGPDKSFSSPDCQSIYVQSGVDTLAQLITTTVAANLANAYTAIATAAPNATVFVVGYPSLLPDAANTPAGGCFTSILGPNGLEPPHPQNAIPFTDIDVPYIHSIEVLLNATIAQQAAAAGFTFIDNQPGSLAHSACPQSASPYVNGITLRSLTVEPLTEPGGLHPNAAGVAFLTAQTVPVIAAAFPAPVPTPTPSPTPTPAATSVPAGLAATGSDHAAAVPVVAVGAVIIAMGALLLTTARRASVTRRRRSES